ncbi:hypothetical protein LDC_0191, partial [sediment metagenome]
MPSPNGFESGDGIEAGAAADPGRWARLLSRLRLRHGLLLQDDTVWDAGTSRCPNLPPSRHADFGAWCREHVGSSCDVWLSSTMVHEWVCDPTLPPS